MSCHGGDYEGGAGPALKGTDLSKDQEHQAIITYLLGYYEEGLPPGARGFIGYLSDERLRRVVTEIEMMSISEECTDDEPERSSESEHRKAGIEYAPGEYHHDEDAEYHDMREG